MSRRGLRTIAVGFGQIAAGPGAIDPEAAVLRSAEAGGAKLEVD